MGLDKESQTHMGHNCPKDRLIRILALGCDSEDYSPPLLLLRRRCEFFFWFTGTRVQRFKLDTLSEQCIL